MARTFKDMPYRVKNARRKKLDKSRSVKRSRLGVKDVQPVDAAETCHVCEIQRGFRKDRVITYNIIYRASEVRELEGLVEELDNLAEESDDTAYSIREIVGHLENADAEAGGRYSYRHFGVLRLVFGDIEKLSEDGVEIYPNRAIREGAAKGDKRIACSFGVSDELHKVYRYDLDNPVYPDYDIAPRQDVFKVVEVAKTIRVGEPNHYPWHKYSGWEDGRACRCSDCSIDDRRETRTKRSTADKSLTTRADYLLRHEGFENLDEEEIFDITDEV